MTSIDWVVIASAAANLALVNWYFFVAGRTVAAAAPGLALSGAGAPIPEVVITVALGIETPEEVLLEAGACGVWRDTGHLYADLDHAIEIAALAAAASH